LRAFLLLVILSGSIIGSQLVSGQAINAELMPGELIVGLQPTQDSRCTPSAVTVDVGDIAESLPNIRAHRIRVRHGISMNEAAALLLKRSEVLYVEYNHVVSAFATPNDTYFAYQYAPQITKANLAWGLWSPKEAIILAVIDTGVDSTHPDLINKIARDESGILGFDAFTNLRSDAMDYNGHGTHATGIAAAQINNGVGVAGISGWTGITGATDASTKIMPIKALDSYGGGTDLTVSAGIIWAADNGARVISMSLGSPSYSYTMGNAIQYAWSKGCVIVAAAGNSGNSSYSYPAAYPHVLSVAATDNTDTLASFSNFGTWVNVAAPGVSIYSTMPSYQATLNSAYGIPLFYGYLSGTSMATPAVAGEAALLIGQNPSLTNSTIFNLIVSNVDTYKPYGTNTIGASAGRINVYNALQAAAAITSQEPTATSDTYTTFQNTALVLTSPGVLVNDTDPLDVPLSAVLVTSPIHGSLIFNSNGSFTYTPTAGYSGADSYTYKAFNGSFYSNVVSVRITVASNSQPPTAANDSYSALQNVAMSVSSPGVLVNDRDPSGLTMSAVLVTSPTHGSLTLNLNGSFVYTPNVNYTGSDTFIYKASNGRLYSNNATVTITTNPIYQPPRATADAYATNANTALTVIAPGVLSNDTDPNGFALTAVLQTNPTHGRLTFSANGSFTYTPTTGYSGPDSFTYKAFDGRSYSGAATVSITVNALTAPKVLTVYTSNAGAGIVISVSPLDNQGRGSGTAPFNRVYNRNTQVTLTAPLTSRNGLKFRKWQRNGKDYSTSRAATVTMDNNYTLTAIYGNAKN
jgi:hypothetical protein